MNRHRLSHFLYVSVGSLDLFDDNSGQISGVRKNTVCTAFDHDIIFFAGDSYLKRDLGTVAGSS